MSALPVKGTLPVYSDVKRQDTNIDLRLCQTHYSYLLLMSLLHNVIYLSCFFPTGGHYRYTGYSSHIALSRDF
ncbi:hypothetical protein CH063_02622 [Colletotrichum higginsianum]|uniref:Uncharacterized protein n=1 Tax=Colletotrichum higginsianum (strain IMI 349063) TaxID=759273 RepID=H1VMX1_COLHI|nr:hypothetical protein CH063_02622 [Colletotrichum higginsianum]